MTLNADPPWIDVTERTAAWSGEILRDTTVWSASTTWAAATTASRVSWGDAAWHDARVGRAILDADTFPEEQ